MRNLEIFLVASFLVLTSGKTDVNLKYVAIIKCSEVEPCVGTIISQKLIITEKTCYCPDEYENLYTDLFYKRESVHLIKQYDENAAALYTFDELSAPMVSIRSTPVNQEDDLFCYIPLVHKSRSTKEAKPTHIPVTWRVESGSICVNEHIPYDVLTKGTPLICNDQLVAFQTQEEATCQRFENITRYIDFLQRYSGEKDENVDTSDSNVPSNDESDNNSNKNLRNTSSSSTVIKELFPVCVILVLAIYNK